MTTLTLRGQLNEWKGILKTTCGQLMSNAPLIAAGKYDESLGRLQKKLAKVKDPMYRHL